MVDTQGRPSALSGNPSPFLVVYKDAFAIGGYCTVIGAVLALDCNGRTGVNAWSVATNQSATFYACGHDYQVLLTGGCVDSLCVSGYVVGRFSLKNRAVLVPTVHARALDVSATGEAGVDWGNVGSPTTAVGLSCTTIFSTQSVVNSVGVPACTAIFSVKSVENAVALDPCGAIFSVRSVLNSVGVGPCATVFSVKSVENTVAIDPCSTVFRVETLSNTATSSILDAAITEPTGVFAWAGATLRNIVGWLGAVTSDCLQQTATTQTLRNRANATTLATSPLTCEATTVHRGSFS